MWPIALFAALIAWGVRSAMKAPKAQYATGALPENVQVVSGPDGAPRWRIVSDDHEADTASVYSLDPTTGATRAVLKFKTTNFGRLLLVKAHGANETDFAHAMLELKVRPVMLGK